MQPSRIISQLALALSLFLIVPCEAATESVVLADLTPNQRLVITQTSTTPVRPIEVKALKLPSIKEQLSIPAKSRRGTFGNSHVDIAPKSWPYPMVVSPGRPVLPGSAW